MDGETRGNRGSVIERIVEKRTEPSTKENLMFQMFQHTLVALSEHNIHFKCVYMVYTMGLLVDQHCYLFPSAHSLCRPIHGQDNLCSC